MKVNRQFVAPVYLPDFLVSQKRLQESGGGGNMALIVIEAVPAGSEPSAVVVVRISPGEEHEFGTSAPSSTGALSLHIIEKAGGSVESS